MAFVVALVLFALLGIAGARVTTYKARVMLGLLFTIIVSAIAHI